MSVLWGVSFDATPLSGVVVEFLKTAHRFAARGHRVHLDLGYDIKADKGAFFRPYRDEARLLPDWVTLDRVEGVERIRGYDREFVERVLSEVVQGGDDALRPEIDRVAGELADRIVATWERLGVTVVMVENGTLPENLAYTEALYTAIGRYGARHRLGRFVFWRDHDLMWQSEPGIAKYGTFPYPGVPAPRNSPHIHYFALHEQAKARTLEWVPELANIDVLPNSFAIAPARIDDRNAAFRRDHGIPEGVPLLARITRIIPQKRIDRDLHLLALLPDVWLFVAGDVGETPTEHARLVDLADLLGVRERVVFGGWLTPYDTAVPGRYSVRDLLAHATIVSFLTSYDYESYGNPISEAIASGTPYITSGYELYDVVYGSFRAPVLDIRARDLPDAAFAREVAELITDEGKRAEVVRVNSELGQARFGARVVDDLVDRLYPPPMGAATRLSVVLPVYNEAANLPEVLRTLHDQRDGDAPLDKGRYEVVLVDNNSTDDTVAIAHAFAAAHPDLALHVIHEPEQGVSCARRAGMDFAAARSRNRPDSDPGERFYLVSADADCRVDPHWLSELFAAMESSKAAIGVCDYYYNAGHFTGRPRLWDAIQRTLRCRAVTFALFGGFPDGKGFAVERDAYERAGGIEIFYQLQDGKFVNHLSDDWDFGIKVASGGDAITYAPRSRVEINPRRVDHAIDEVIAGRAYGSDGIIVMRDIRPSAPSATADLTEAEAQQAWEFSIKDFTPKNTILPVLLTPALLEDDAVIAFFGPDLAARLARRISELRHEMRVVDFTPIHAYKTPSYRLYFEFADELFACLRRHVGADIGHPPPLPPCLAEVPAERFAEFVRYYCEDRESGEAHNYFGNGGVF
ncbi:glycosyltransferase [Amycolatopsis mediterranei]|uniref:glycosyltransferase n=1 Tax=Amycolatopsis mediterranei TaxID=33910 RepID=UPI000AE138EE|nr:glycosyltransferase [Amycolatopsis mediterranei]UZF72001.1 glycosyltransferase [Amycolatopsis mediterranei]